MIDPNGVCYRMGTIRNVLQLSGMIHRQHGRFKVYLKQMFGHHNAVFDYLETGDMPSLNPTTAPPPLGDRVLQSVGLCVFAAGRHPESEGALRGDAPRRTSHANDQLVTLQF